MQAPLDACREAIRPIENNPTEGLVPFSIDNSESSISERFERIVRQHPDRLAVKMGARALTYDELNRTANRIAHAILAQRGTTSEPIALILEQGIDIIAAILGVLKAGKFYVVLDTSMPRDRNAYILENSGAAFIIADAGTSSLARAEARGRAWLNLGEIDHACASSDPCVAVSPGDLRPFSILPVPPAIPRALCTAIEVNSTPYWSTPTLLAFLVRIY